MDEIKSEKKETGKNRARGKRFEDKSREFLEQQGLVAGRWLNQLELKDGEYKMVPAKPLMKFNPYKKTMQLLNLYTGFPDFFGYPPGKETEVFGYESKKAKYLDKEEKAKCSWYLKNFIFSKIFILYPGEKRGTVTMWEYKDEEEAKDL